MRLLLFILGLLTLANLLVAAPDTRISPENAASLVEIARLGQGRATSALFSPDGDILAVASSIGVWLYDADDFTAPPQLFEGHSGYVNDLAFSPDSRILASASSDQTIRLWDVESRTETAVLRGHNGLALSVAFNDDGTLLASAGDDGIRLWNLRENNRSVVLEGPTGSVSHVAFQPGGALLASSTDSFFYDPVRVRLWDTNTREELSPPDEKAGSAPATFSPDGQLLAMQVGNNLQLWDVRAQTFRLTLTDNLPAYYSLDLSPDGAVLAVGAWGIIELWEVASGSKRARLDAPDAPIRSLSFSPDGQYLLGVAHGQVHVWDVPNGEALPPLDGFYGGVGDVAFNPDGTLLASAHSLFINCHPLQLWEAASGTRLPEVDPNGCQESVAFSPSGLLVVDGFDPGDGTLLQLWDTESRVRVTSLYRYGYSVYGIAFPADGRWVAATGETNAGSNNTGHVVQVWDVESGEEVFYLDGPGRAADVVFSPDGRLLVYSQSILIHVWDMQNHTEIATLEGHQDDVNALAFSPDGALLASCGYDYTLRIWDAKTFSETKQVDGCLDGLAFSPDGTLLAYGAENVVRLLDVKSRADVATLTAHTDTVTDVAFNADGTLLASAAWDGTVRLWAVRGD